MKQCETPPPSAAAGGRARARPRFGAPRLLIVGCGDVGLRIVSRVRRRLRLIALTSIPARAPAGIRRRASRL